MVGRSKSKLLQVWLPREICEDFEEWLKINSVGANTSERHRQYIYQVIAGNVVLKDKAVQEGIQKRINQRVEEEKTEKKKGITILGNPPKKVHIAPQSWINPKSKNYKPHWKWIYNKKIQGMQKIPTDLKIVREGNLFKGNA